MKGKHMEARPDLEDLEHWSSPNGCHSDCPACNKPAEKDKALELLGRGYECGIFDDAPVYKRDVRKLLKSEGVL